MNKRIVARSTLQSICTQPAVQCVITTGTINEIVAFTANNRLIGFVSGQIIIMVRTNEVLYVFQTISIRPVRGNNETFAICATAEINGDATAATAEVNDIAVAFTAVKCIATFAANQNVITGTGFERIVCCTTFHDIIKITTDDMFDVDQRIDVGFINGDVIFVQGQIGYDGAGASAVISNIAICATI